jgi:hypothetical protein
MEKYYLKTSAKSLKKQFPWQYLIRASLNAMHIGEMISKNFFQIIAI